MTAYQNTERDHVTKVHLVEDDEAIRFALGRVLTARGMSVAELSCGSAATELLTREMPDVLVTDLALPDIDGQELALRYRARGPVVVFLISGAPHARAIRPELKDATLLAKPFVFRDLAEQIARSMG